VHRVDPADQSRSGNLYTRQCLLPLALDQCQRCAFDARGLSTTEPCDALAQRGCADQPVQLAHQILGTSAECGRHDASCSLATPKPQTPTSHRRRIDAGEACGTGECLA
jgi:hypothetical protein